MLPFLLAILVGIAGLALFSTAFFFPGLYRKNDIVWGGVALFYGLVLWICAPRITGAVLLGQAASISLTGWLGWQALMWRWSKLPPEQRSTIADGSSVKQGLETIKRTDWKDKLQSSSQTVQEQLKSGAATAKTTQEAVAETVTAPVDSATAVVEMVTESIVEIGEEDAEAIAQEEASPAPAATHSEAPSTTPSSQSAGTEKPKAAPSTRQPSRNTALVSGLALVAGAIGQLRDRLQGRKAHGKKYVRPEDVTGTTDGATTDETDGESLIKADEAAAIAAIEVPAVEIPAIESSAVKPTEPESAEPKTSAVTEATAETTPAPPAHDPGEAEADHATIESAASREAADSAEAEPATPLSTPAPPLAESGDDAHRESSDELETAPAIDVEVMAPSEEETNWPPRDETWSEEPEEWEQDNNERP